MDKFTSGATCAAGPALAWQGDASILWVAFAGGGGLGAAAPNFKLNVMPIQVSSPNDKWSYERLLVLSETTAEQPALTFFNGSLWLAWAGTDAAHRLNLILLGVDGEYRLSEKSKTTLNWTATGGPSLLPHNGQLYMAFSGGGGLGAAAPNGSTNIAFSTNGTDWPQSQLQVLNTHSVLSPSLAKTPSSDGAPEVLYVAFTGTNHCIYLTNDFRRAGELGTQIQILGTPDHAETTDYAPSISIAPSNDGSSGLVLWTGSGDDRHLWSMGGNGLPLNSEGSVGFGFRQECADTSQFAPAVLRTNQGTFVAWAGTDNAHRLNIADYFSLPKLP